LLTEKAIAELAQHRLDVQVSLDSHLAQKHDAIRGTGVFAKTIKGVTGLVNAGIHTTLSMVYSASNIEDFEPYLNLAKSLGVHEVRFIPLRLIGRGRGCQKISPNQAQAFRHLMEILQRRSDLRPLLVRDYFSIIMTICRFSTPRSGCGIGRKVIFIDADGQVYPCPNHVSRTHACGNVAEKSLTDIVMNSGVMRKMREQYQVANYSSCHDCPFGYWCAGDCRGEVLSITGDPLAPSPHCEELKQVMKDMLWLIAEGNTHLGTTSQLANGKRIGDLFQV
jgi:radical SAM protein with 4Fe4S-binding SPASM domain